MQGDGIVLADRDRNTALGKAGGGIGKFAFGEQENAAMAGIAEFQGGAQTGACALARGRAL